MAITPNLVQLSKHYYLGLMRRNMISSHVPGKRTNDFSSSIHPFQMGHWFASYYQHYQCNLNLTHICSMLVLFKNTQSVPRLCIVMLNGSIFLYIAEKWSNGAVRCLRETGYLTKRSIFMTMRRFFCIVRNKSW